MIQAPKRAINSQAHEPPRRFSDHMLFNVVRKTRDVHFWCTSEGPLLPLTISIAFADESIHFSTHAQENVSMNASNLLCWLEESTASSLVPTGTDELQFRPPLQQAPLCSLEPTVARGSWRGLSVSPYQELVSGEEITGQLLRFVQIATKQSCAQEQPFGTSGIHFPVQVRHNVCCNRSLLFLQVS